MTRRIMWLELEGGAAVNIHSVARSNAAWQGGEPYEDLPVPEGAVEVTATGPTGRAETLFARPVVLEGLRHLVSEGVDVVWSTRWLTAPDRLTEVAAALGLEGVRMPTAAESPVAPNQDWIGIRTTPYWEHWKVRSLVETARGLGAEDELVVVDPALDISARRLADGIARRLKRDDLRIGSLSPDADDGLDASAIGRLRDWAGGASLAASRLAVAPPAEPTWHRAAD